MPSSSQCSPLLGVCILHPALSSLLLVRSLGRLLLQLLDCLFCGGVLAAIRLDLTHRQHRVY
jgi:hypothetical protein